MLKFVSWYVVLEILLVVVAISITIWLGKNRLKVKGQRVPEGFVRTEEIFIDPTTGIKQQVWFNSRTGERYYETKKE